MTSEDLEKLYELYPKGWWGGSLARKWNRSWKLPFLQNKAKKQSRQGQSAVSKKLKSNPFTRSWKKKHQDSWDTPHLKLMYCIRNSWRLRYSPDSPALLAAAPKGARKESVSEAIGGRWSCCCCCEGLKIWSQREGWWKFNLVSPGRAVDLRMKNFQQLQQLYEDISWMMRSMLSKKEVFWGHFEI